MKKQTRINKNNHNQENGTNYKKKVSYTTTTLAAKAGIFSRAITMRVVYLPARDDCGSSLP
jgi:hypothetical protein